MEEPREIPGQLSVLRQGKVEMVSYEEGSRHPWADKVDSLYLRSKVLEMELPQWVNARLEQHGAKPESLEGMRQYVYDQIDNELKGLERAAKRVKQEAKRIAKGHTPRLNLNLEDCPGPVALPGYLVRPVGDGSFTHVSSIEHTNDEAAKDDLERIFNWLDSIGLGRALGFTHWGAMNLPQSKTNLYKFQEKMALLARQHRKQGLLKENTEAPKAVSGLFAGLKKTEAPKSLFTTPMKKTEEGNVITPEGEVVKPNDRIETMQRKLEQERITENADEVRERLGLGHIPYKIENRYQVDAILQKRTAILHELAFVMQQHEIIKNRLESAINELDVMWYDELEKFRLANPPATGKTLSTHYGDLCLRNTPVYVAADENQDKEMQRWLKDNFANPDRRQQFGIFQLPERFGYDHKALTGYIKEIIDKTKKVPLIPVRITEAETDKFFISPSLDTFKKNTREDIKKAAAI